MEEGIKPLRATEVNERLSAGWIMVLIKGKGRGHMDDLEQDVERYEEACRWAEQQIGSMTFKWDAYGLYTFLFEDPKEAMLFKLAWGMQN